MNAFNRFILIELIQYGRRIGKKVYSEGKILLCYIFKKRLYLGCFGSDLDKNFTQTLKNDDF